MSAPGSDLFGLYVHWPFCLKKCPYCDFNSHVRAAVDHDVWAAALVQELAHLAARTDRGPLTSIFFGGGTPSLMDPKTVGAVIDRAQSLFTFADDIEITLEANPTSADQARFTGYRAAGVNRVSLGVQSLRDEALQFLGRQHSVAEAMAALTMAQSTFDRVSFDLIYARPDQTVGEWQAELAEGVALGTDHMSVYQLTIEPETEFGKLYQMGRLTPLDDDPAADLYEVTQGMMDDAGMAAYETSNHARGVQNRARHNLTYWQAAPYLGVGPGAHGRVLVNGQKHATIAARTPEDWLRRVTDQGHGFIEWQSLTEQEQAEEALLMGLRLTDGVLLDRVRPALDPAALERLIDDGFVEVDDTTLKATKKGHPVLNAVLGALVAG